MTGTSACAPTRRSSRTSSSAGTGRTRSSGGRVVRTRVGPRRLRAAGWTAPDWRPRRRSSWRRCSPGRMRRRGSRRRCSATGRGTCSCPCSVRATRSGHQSWHVHDPEHPRHDPGVRERIGDPLAQVYERLDRALAEHLALLGADTTCSSPQSRDRTALRRHPPPARDPAAAERLLRGTGPALVAGPRARAARGARCRPPLAPSRSRWSRARCGRARARGGRGSSVTLRRTMSAAISCSSCLRTTSSSEGVRINLRGREREGMVAPGREFDQLCDRLGEDFLTLVNVETGAPVVRSVERTDDALLRVITSMPCPICSSSGITIIRSRRSGRRGSG